MTAQRARSFARKGTRRLIQWIGPADQGFVSVASAGAILLFNFAITEPVTVVRVRGQVAIEMANAANLNVIGAIGMVIVSAEAFAAGVASVPEPFSNADWGGWFVWRSFSYRMAVGDQTGFRVISRDFEIDSKAMRKVSPNEVIVMVVEFQAGAFSVSAPLRMLLKLS